jgi:hypothetical protein
MALSWKKMLPRTVIAKEEKLESDFKTDWLLSGAKAAEGTIHLPFWKFEGPKEQR